MNLKNKKVRRSNILSMLALSFLVILACANILAADRPKQLDMPADMTMGRSLVGSDNALIDWEPPLEKRIEEYLSVHAEFIKEVCHPKDVSRYRGLYRGYFGEAVRIPLLNEKKGEIDYEAVESSLPEFSKKHRWILQEIAKLKKNSKYDISGNIKSIQALLEELLSYKYQLNNFKDDNDNDKKIKTETEKQSKKKLQELFTLYKEMVDKISFMQNYVFPVDYLALRKNYDNYNNKRDIESIKKRNRIFLQRKLLEDGALAVKGNSSDRYIRALLSTLYLRLENHQGSVLEEDVRYDLSSLLKVLPAFVSNNRLVVISESSKKKKKRKKRQIRGRTLLARMEDWKNKNLHSWAFAYRLVKSSQKSRQSIDLPKEVTRDPLFKMSEQAFANLVKVIAIKRHTLRDLNFVKQREVYRFWSKQPELIQALFTLETILFNEVGGMDNRSGCERKDIVQLVINRYHVPFYTSIAPEDPFFNYLAGGENGNKEEKIEQSRWLNLLFKDGEFSFTYFFIPLSERIYCPLTTKYAKTLRRGNLEIALSMLKNPRYDFKALRFFSRHAMLGRIDMSSIWADYAPIELRAGPMVEEHASDIYWQALLDQDYDYLDSFSGSDGKIYHTLELATGKNGKRSTLLFDGNLEASKEKEKAGNSREKGDFFYFRNNQHFKYFCPKN
ncbi:MAG: hypothetical protein HQK52_02865 [Oligoflexia bacterium]|nr:hypothetical protein [Oligoflexia bacterium]